ncbi:MAG: prepilin-type N-terminal cleavage/methylation domain-containing protein [Planctomycetaceae bacterium]|jgi:type II secretory pathway pseudopilin PulG|nr:prepilin-type N-terminal cleavage/methylation domain-containing protein [Planctomycetaceae bacterium]
MSGKDRRFGFTLIELLISTTLLIVLFAILWGLVGMFSRSFQSGEKRAERSQLVRSISQLLADDLSCAIQDPLHPTRETNANSARRFGLSGTKTSLRIDAIQINPFRTGDQTAQNGVQAPELKTISYDFSLLSPNGGGLIRREFDFETPLSSQPRQTGDWQLATSAPEVVGCLFRYYDGNRWHDSWNSLERKGLPIAIEITLQLTTLADAETLRNSPLAGQIINIPPRQNRLGNAAQNIETTTENVIGSNAPSLGDFAANAVSSGDLGDAPTASDRILEQNTPRQNGALSSGTFGRWTLEDAAKQLDLPPPTEQRIVVCVPTSPLAAQQELRRERPQANLRSSRQTKAASQPSTQQSASPRRRTSPRRSSQQTPPPTPQSPDWIRQ